MFVTYAKKEQTPLRKGRAAGIIKATPRNLRCCFKTSFEAGGRNGMLDMDRKAKRRFSFAKSAFLTRRRGGIAAF
jgi:hypothetical protein